VLRVILYVKGLGVLGFHDKGIDVQSVCDTCLGIVLSGVNKYYIYYGTYNAIPIL
jgi:hypothetical protein